MDPIIGGALVSGVSNLLGGLFGKSSADKANRRNIQLQREFAQKGIQWKVADAKAAGVHPLAALGASTVSFSPSVVGDNSLGQGIANAGQDIGRAINATSDANTRASNLQTQVAEETLKGLRLDNQGKAIQNAALASRTVRMAQVGAPFPSADGSTNTGIPGQATSAKSSGLSIGASGALPAFPGSTSNALGNAFGELVEDFGGAVNLRDSMARMNTNQKFALLQAVFPGFQWAAMNLGRKYRPPANYGPRVTTKSFRSTFQ